MQTTEELRPAEPAIAPRQPTLEDRIRQACRVRHYSLATERIFVAWYKRFVRIAGLKHPATLGAVIGLRS
jgi:hypothetical protein